MLPESVGVEVLGIFHIKIVMTQHISRAALRSNKNHIRLLNANIRHIRLLLAIGAEDNNYKAAYTVSQY